MVDTSMEYFKTQITQIKHELTNLRNYTQTYDSKIKEKSTSVFSDAKEKNLNATIRATEQIFRETTIKVKDMLKTMQTENDEISQNNIYNKMTMILETRKSQCNACLASLREIIMNFNEIQEKNKDMEEQRTISQYLVENPNINSEQAKKKMEEDKKKISGRLSEAEEKNKRVEQISIMVNELLELINEIDDLVKADSTTIDMIEVKMAGSDKKSEHAKQNLRSALRYQINATRIKRILFVIVLCLILGLFGFIAYKIVTGLGGVQGGNGNGNNGGNENNG